MPAQACQARLSSQGGCSHAVVHPLDISFRRMRSAQRKNCRLLVLKVFQILERRNHQEIPHVLVKPIGSRCCHERGIQPRSQQHSTHVSQRGMLKVTGKWKISNPCKQCPPTVYGHARWMRVAGFAHKIQLGCYSSRMGCGRECLWSDIPLP